MEIYLRLSKTYAATTMTAATAIAATMATSVESHASPCSIGIEAEPTGSTLKYVKMMNHNKH